MICVIDHLGTTGLPTSALVFNEVLISVLSTNYSPIATPEIHIQFLGQFTMENKLLKGCLA